jgi:hypothetical protein
MIAQAGRTAKTRPEARVKQPRLLRSQVSAWLSFPVRARGPDRHGCGAQPGPGRQVGADGEPRRVQGPL